MITPEEIIRIVADYYHLDKIDLIIRNRNERFVKARHIAMYYCRHKTEFTLREIGNAFDYRSHDTVIHAIKSVENQVETNKRYREDFKDIELHIEQSILKEKIYSEIIESEVYQENDFY